MSTFFHYKYIEQQQEEIQPVIYSLVPEEEEEEEQEVSEEEPYKPPTKSLDEILNDTQFSSKLREIAERNEQNKQSGNIDKLIKARILQGLPYQLQQEIMTDNYQNKTPMILTEYFAHQQKINQHKQKDSNDASTKPMLVYYPQHFMRMKEKAKKDRRFARSAGSPKKRPLRVSNGSKSPDGKKKAPAYLRVASPEVLEKMQFSKGARSSVMIYVNICKSNK